MLKEEQDAIARRLAFLDSQIEASREVFENAKAHLEDILGLASGAYQLYTSLPNVERRICNLAFFDRINVTEVDRVEGEPHWGMELVLNPGIQATALKAHQSGDAGDYEAFTACVDSYFVTGLVLLGALRLVNRLQSPRSRKPAFLPLASIACGPRGARTHDQRIKSPVLCQLS